MIINLSQDPDCLRVLALLTSTICNGLLPSQAMDLLKCSRLIAQAKPTDPRSHRPIAIGEVFLRMATSYLCSDLTPEIARILSPLNYGVGISGGCEIVSHRLHDALRRGHAVLKCDISNAFNTMHRAAMLSALYSHRSLQKLWPLASACYGSPPPSLYKVPMASTGSHPLEASARAAF